MAETVPVSPEIKAVIGEENLKTVAGMGAHSMALAMSNAVAHQGRLNILAEATLAAAIKGVQEIDPSEAISTLKTLTGDDTAQKLANLLAALGSGQQAVKTSQTTPPNTAGTT